MMEAIKWVIYWANEGTYSNLKYFIPKEQLRNYIHKKSIFSRFLYISPEYRNKNYGEILRNYAHTIGDYTWGISLKDKTAEYWLNNENRITIMEWENKEGHINVLTATKL